MFGLVVGWLPGLSADQPILICRVGRATKHSLDLLYHGDLRTVQWDLLLACRLLESAVKGRLLPERAPSAPVRGMLLFRSWGRTGDARALVFAELELAPRLGPTVEDVMDLRTLLGNDWWLVEVEAEGRPSRGRWYQPGACGYTNTLAEAGLFTREEAERHVRDITTVVRLQDLLSDLGQPLEQAERERRDAAWEAERERWVSCA